VVQHTSKVLLIVVGAVGAGCASAPAPSRPQLEAPLRGVFVPPERASSTSEVDPHPLTSSPDPVLDSPRSDPEPPWAKLDTALTLAGPGARNVTIVVGRGLPHDSPPPVITVLHANCVGSVDNCSFLREIADGRAVLVCPTGNVPCNNGAAVWGVSLQAVVDDVEGSLVTASSALGENGPHTHDVLFGSSGGAFAARNLINSGRTGWSGLVLVGAKIQLDLAATRRAGIRRVLLAAPDGDMAAPAMRAEKATLCRAGIPARFVGLGPHGHGMDDASPGILAANMDWVMGISDDGGGATGCP